MLLALGSVSLVSLLRNLLYTYDTPICYLSISRFLCSASCSLASFSFLLFRLSLIFYSIVAYLDR